MHDLHFCRFEAHVCVLCVYVCECVYAYLKPITKELTPIQYLTYVGTQGLEGGEGTGQP